VDTTLHVSLKFPEFMPPCDSFCFPIIVPGTYEKVKYGKYISDFKAYNADGNAIPYHKLDSAVFRFDSLQPVRSIEYVVNQTFTYKSDSILVFIGSKFGSKHCILNLHAIAGFFPQLMDKSIRIHFVMPDNWKVGTSLETDSSGYLYAKSYHELLDNPIIAGNITNYAFQKDSIKYFIYVYSDSASITARRLKRDVISAVEDFHSFIPSPQYTYYSFLFNFLNDSSSSIGALEHRQSSLYTVASREFSKINGNVDWVIRHELFHTITPLSLKGSEIKDKDYLSDREVTNLWFYEGLAQWAAFKMQLINGTIDLDDYLKILGNSLTFQEFQDDSLSVIQLSQRAFKTKENLPIIYRKGLIIGTLLDLKIIELTNGKKTLREVLLELNKQFSSGQTFASDSLITIISELTHPDIRPFIDSLLFSNDLSGIEGLFKTFDIKYVKRERHYFFKSDLGIAMYYSPSKKRYVIEGVDKEARQYGFTIGDVLQSINGNTITSSLYIPELKDLFISSPGMSFNVVVRNQKGEIHTIQAKSVPYYIRNKFEINSTESSLYNVLTGR
jgi:predicted metalloprotease with PDZ domain